jgi:hypothetical protein
MPAPYYIEEIMLPYRRRADAGWRPLFRRRLGAGFTIFVLFFGLATIEAVQNQNWGASLLWLAFGVACVLMDNLGEKR